MYADISKPPPPLPQPHLQEIQPGLSLLAPLTRCGQGGPGIIILVPDATTGLKIEKGVPSPVVKWTEEGFAVAELQASAFAGDTGSLKQAVESLKQYKSCEPKEKIGLVVYNPELWDEAEAALPHLSEIVAAVIYANQQTSTTKQSSLPTLLHIAGQQPSDLPKRIDSSKQYYYPSVKSHKFATPFNPDFHYNSEAISHTRNLTFLKTKLGGPYFDLEAIWDEHTYYEFADRSVQHTMSTMVQEPYVNHVPTLTGGVGRDSLTQFYADSFIFSNSADTELELISRTVGIDRVIDEFIFKFTHDQEIPWMLPGIPPTNLRVETPFTAVVNIRGDRLYHEHISWDQGNVLRQLKLLPEYLPFPHALPVPDGKTVAAAPPGETFEYRVPVAGIEATHKMKDRNSVPSNEMFNFKIRTVGEGVPNGSAKMNGQHVNGETNGLSS